MIETCFREHYARLCYFAAKFTGDRLAAEDVVQDAFLKLWNHTGAFEDMEARSFLYTTVRNACLNLIRHGKVEQKFAATVSDAPPEEQQLGLDLLIRAEVLGQIHQAVEMLPEGCRKVLKLAYFESLKNEEIAQQLGISVNTVKTQKARALQLLRLRLTTPAYLLFLYLYS